MPFQTCWMILICLCIGISGCVKAVAPKPAPPQAEAPAPPQVVWEDPYASEIPLEYLHRLRSLSDAADEVASLTLVTIADHFSARGEVDKALHFLDRAVEGFQLGRNGSGEATAWGRKVMLLLRFNRDQEAIRLIREAGEKWRSAPLTAFPAYWEGHHALLEGDFPRSRERLNRSRQNNATFPEDPYLRMLRRDVELDAGIAEILFDRLPRLLAIYGLSGTPVSRGEGTGQTHLRHVLALNDELRQTKLGRFLPAADFKRSEADAHNFLGLEAWMGGKREEALHHLAVAGELSHAAGYPAAEILSLLFTGELGLQWEEGPEGRRAAERLLERADHYRISCYRIWARLLLSRYEAREGRPRQAIARLEEAALVIEAGRSGLKAEMVDVVCRRQRRVVYESLVELLAGEGMVPEAWAAAEKGKALTMVDLLAGQDLGRDPAEKRWLGQEVGIGEEIRDLQQRLLQVSDGAVADRLLERMKLAEAGRRELLDRIGAENGNLLSLIAARGVDLTTLQSLLDENTTLFDYFATAGGLYVWAIHRGRIHQERIDLSREELRSLVFSFLAAIRDRNKRKTETLSRKVYDLLLKPVIPFVSGERIGFIPDDALVYLPFAAMNYRGRYLVEGFSIFQLPVAGLLGAAAAEKGTQGLRILAFGDPDLEDESLDLHSAPRELEQIRKQIGGTTVLLGPEASEAKAGEMPAGYDILHFAVRGQFFPEEVLNSGLLLTPGAGRDGRLTIREIFGLRFRGTGIVLSGCEPLPENDPEGKGLVAMQRAFLNTGSPAVVFTLWLSDDKAAAHLLERFYRQLDRRGSFADALRAAQLHLLREGQPPHVWAAFVLTGGE